jgi:large subunit ribosomal protein L6
MSRIGEAPIEIPAGVTVTASGAQLTVKGGKGELAITLPGTVSAEVAEGRLTLARTGDTRESRSLHGLVRSLAANMVKGVTEGFSKTLEIEGVGFRAGVQGKKLVLSVGFSKPVEYTVPDDITVAAEGDTKVVVSGADKQKVGQVAARIRGFCPCEPYKGKGIRYSDEHVRRKVGKTVA